jgi:hypothetical protein
MCWLHLFLHHARSSNRLEQPATDDDADIKHNFLFLWAFKTFLGT